MKLLQKNRPCWQVNKVRPRAKRWKSWSPWARSMARRLIPVSSVQIAGVSYDNLGEAGLQFLTEMADGGGKARVLATLNPAGMDVENWQNLGISPEFAEKQERVIDAFARMGVVTTCTCTPYLSGNLPGMRRAYRLGGKRRGVLRQFGVGARTNREGGPSALAAALTGRTPAYGFHLDENRQPGLTRAGGSPTLVEATNLARWARRLGRQLRGREKKVALHPGVGGPPWKSSNPSAPAWPPMAGWHCSTCRASPPKRRWRHTVW